MEKQNSERAFFVGFLVGGVVGSVLTLWLSERVRRELEERGIDRGDRMADLGTLIREKADQFLARTKEAVKQAVEERRKTKDKACSDLEERSTKESRE